MSGHREISGGRSTREEDRMPKQYKVFSVEDTQQNPKKERWGWVLLDDNGEPLAVSASFHGNERDAKDHAKKTKENANAPVTGP